MFISPEVAIDNGWIKGDIQLKNVQPNAIDFTLDKLYTIDDAAPFVINEENKRMRGGEEVQTSKESGITDYDGKYYWTLKPHTTYDFMSDFYVEIPEGVACQLVIRSTLNRNGLFLTSGLYDSGFKGHIAGAIHNRSGFAFIEPGTRVGQIIFVESKNAGMYAGGYNTDEGKHYSEM